MLFTAPWRMLLQQQTSEQAPKVVVETSQRTTVSLGVSIGIPHFDVPEYVECDSTDLQKVTGNSAELGDQTQRIQPR